MEELESAWDSVRHLRKTLEQQLHEAHEAGAAAERAEAAVKLAAAEAAWEARLATHAPERETHTADAFSDIATSLEAHFRYVCRMWWLTFFRVCVLV